MSVSVITTVISVSTLTIATAVFGVTAWIANIIATTVATGPGYTLNRRWTWGIRDASDPWRQVAPFWLLSFAGLGLSTLAVAVTDSWAAQMQLAGVVRTGAVLGAHLSGFGVLWVIQFVLLDRVLFRRPQAYAMGHSAPVCAASSERNSAAFLPGDAA
jgi:putative flippase GtrA